MAKISDLQVIKQYCKRMGGVTPCTGCPAQIGNQYTYCAFEYSPDLWDLRTVNRIVREMRQELEDRP